MPIYEFRCQACGRVFEHLALRQGEKGQAQCPGCGGEELARVMSACSSVVEGGSGSAGQPAGGVESRSCGDSGSCATITLPGHSR
jgi:putative FmdB family regulatory protein